MEATMFNKSSSSSSTISMHKQSHSVTKTKPRIRIIHIYAPKIIKTDVANFRELVQSLTGKREDRRGGGQSKAKPRREDDVHRQVQDMISMEKLREPNHCDQRAYCCLRSSSEMEDDNEEISMTTWNGNNGGGEFLNGLGDFEEFIQELADFPYLPFSMDASASSSPSSSLHGGSMFSDSHHQFLSQTK